jgi:hypothetical protein
MMNFCKILIVLTASMVFYACNDDEGRSCTTCSSDETAPFELCQEPNGNASINGQDTDTEYDVYLAGLQEAGVQCGG